MNNCNIFIKISLSKDSLNKSIYHKYFKNIFLYFEKVFKLFLTIISYRNPGGTIKWKMLEIILIPRGYSEWPLEFYHNPGPESFIQYPFGH